MDLHRRHFVALVLAAAASAPALRAIAAGGDPLPSWSEGPSKQAILDFVKDVTTQGGPKFAPPEDRIACFDQDGTLWVEHPLSTASSSIASTACPRS